MGKKKTAIENGRDLNDSGSISTDHTTPGALTGTVPAQTSETPPPAHVSPAVLGFQARLRRFMEENGLISQKQLARILRTSPTTVSRWFNSGKPPKKKEWGKLTAIGLMTESYLSELIIENYQWRVRTRPLKPRLQILKDDLFRKALRVKSELLHRPRLEWLPEERQLANALDALLRLEY